MEQEGKKKQRDDVRQDESHDAGARSSPVSTGSGEKLVRWRECIGGPAGQQTARL
jgi:hypothetical protein